MLPALILWRVQQCVKTPTFNVTAKKSSFAIIKELVYATHPKSFFINYCRSNPYDNTQRRIQGVSEIIVEISMVP